MSVIMDTVEMIDGPCVGRTIDLPTALAIGSLLHLSWKVASKCGDDFAEYRLTDQESPAGYAACEFVRGVRRDVRTGRPIITEGGRVNSSQI